MKVEIESKYNVGDEVYIPNDDYCEVVKCRVESIILSYTTSYGINEQIKYILYSIPDNLAKGVHHQWRVYDNEAECLKYCQDKSERLGEDRCSEFKD